jgi:hypothetical protein
MYAPLYLGRNLRALNPLQATDCGPEGELTAGRRWFDLYLIRDLFSRRIVGFGVHETDSSDYAVDLLRRTALAEDLHTLDHKSVLHGDNGSTLKATTVLAMMHWLGLESLVLPPARQRAGSAGRSRTARCTDRSASA